MSRVAAELAAARCCSALPPRLATALAAPFGVCLRTVSITGDLVRNLPAFPPTGAPARLAEPLISDLRLLIRVLAPLNSLAADDLRDAMPGAPLVRALFVLAARSLRPAFERLMPFKASVRCDTPPPPVPENRPLLSRLIAMVLVSDLVQSNASAASSTSV